MKFHNLPSTLLPSNAPTGARNCGRHAALVLFLLLLSWCGCLGNRHSHVAESTSAKEEKCAHDEGPSSTPFDPNKAFRLLAYKVRTSTDCDIVIAELMNISDTPVDVRCGDPAWLSGEGFDDDPVAIRNNANQADHWWMWFASVSNVPFESQNGVSRFVFSGTYNAYNHTMRKYATNPPAGRSVDDQPWYQRFLSKQPNLGWRKIAPRERVYAFMGANCAPLAPNESDRKQLADPNSVPISEISLWNVEMYLKVRWPGGERMIMCVSPWEVEFADRPNPYAQRQHWRGPASARAP